MDSASHAGVPQPGVHGRRPEPRWITLADLGVIVAGFALLMSIPLRASVWPPYLSPPPFLVVVLFGGLRLTVGFGVVLALVVLCRRWRYGGPVRPAEWLALGVAARGLLEVVPNLDDAVNAHRAAVGSTALDFGVVRWLLSAAAAAGVVLVGAGLVLLRQPVSDGSRIASALTVVGVLGGLFLWFWGPCEVARLQLPWLLVPGPSGDPSSWGWRAPVVFAVRYIVANGPTAFIWGIAGAATVRAWWADRRGRPHVWVWTELAAVANAVVIAGLLLMFGDPQGLDLIWRLSWMASVGLISWWITGRLGVGRHPSPSAQWSVA